MISICVPTIGRSTLEPALASIDVARGRLSSTVDVVVADASGTVRERPGVRVVANPVGTASAARNLAVEAAEGDVLLFLDDDCRLEPEHLARLEARLAAEPRFDAWSGLTVRDPGDDPLQVAWQAMFDLPFSAPSRHAWLRWAPSTNFVLRRAAFDALGGFAALPLPVGGEDTDLCLRLTAAGLGPIRSAPELVCRHAPDEPGKLLEKAFRYGAAVQLVMERHAPRSRPAPPRALLYANTPQGRLLEAYARGARSVRSPPPRPLPGPVTDALDDVDGRLALGDDVLELRALIEAAGHLLLAAGGGRLLVHLRGPAPWPHVPGLEPATKAGSQPFRGPR